MSQTLKILVNIVFDKVTPLVMSVPTTDKQYDIQKKVPKLQNFAIIELCV